jgi:hypothetical protein
MSRDRFRWRTSDCRAGPDGLADFVVLAKHTPKIAVGEKDRSRSVPAPKAILFSKVCEMTVNDRVAAGLAGSPFVLHPIDAAVARTHPAVFESLQRFLSFLGNL